MTTDTPSSPSETTRVKPPRKQRSGRSRKRVAEPWHSRMSGLFGPTLYIATIVVMVSGYFVYHRPQPQPEPDSANVSVSQLVTDVAKVFPPEDDDKAIAYAAFYAACELKVRHDGENIPEATVLRVFEIRDTPRVKALDPIVEDYMQRVKDIPASGTLSDTQRDLLASTFHDLSEACLAASRD